MRFEPGTPVRCEMTKWPDRPHWVFAGRYLGADEHGDWIGFPAGSRFTRPGADYVAPYDQVGLVPHDGLPERGWIAAFHDPRGSVRVYVDIATPPAWDGATVRSVDLDLDVVQGLTGRVWVDDEDEFADHRERWAYPEQLVAGALASCRSVEDVVRRGEPPFDGSSSRAWLAVLAADRTPQ
ncbi:DUF402 domain-containing protein [Nocardioides euryhalodurans]|uniref:DUF402 domain-containing protein n=1 Tax=Nocardioides euryhalodurans TaxID=2518370 RepID=A0A4P7GJQ1_9ACTN|nr:DUF402 domain-containing protein [Nocardioides euryhalodurans]QBR92226.1 DUF402 domain-containing protein [Nocardioides euryhalodurans]